MNDDQFDKLFKYMQEMRQEISGKIGGIRAEIKGDISCIRDILDHHTSLLETDELERLALSKQVGRHEDWVTRASAKTGIHYQPSA